jgi:hypothetical protein
VAGAPYVWWVGPEEQSYTCAFCGAPVSVESVRITKPIEDPTHPWWQVPQGLSYRDSLSYWEAHGYYRPFI